MTRRRLGGEPVVFGSSREHLLAEVTRVDLLVRAQIARARRASTDDAFRGLAISDEEVDALLEREPGAPHWTAAPALPELVEIEAKLAAAIERRAAVTLDRGVPLRLHALAERFQLDRFEVTLLLIALLPELDARYERLFAYLQDDVTRRRPSVDLVLSLLCPTMEARLDARARLHPGAPLLRHGLVRLFADPSQPHAPLISLGCKVDERVVAFLHDSDAIDGWLADCARLIVPERGLDQLLLGEPMRARLPALLDHHRVVYLRGPRGSGKKAVAEALCRAREKNLLVVNLETLAASPDAAALLAVAAREALLGDAILFCERFDVLLADDKRALLASLARLAASLGAPLLLAGEAAWDPSGALAGICVELEPPSVAERVVLWTRALAGEPEPAPDVDLAALAARYRLTGGQIFDAAAGARGRARFRGHERVGADALAESCRAQSQPHLGALARKLATPHTWDDLVLPPDHLERLAEICTHARHRARVFETWGFARKLTLGKGLVALFTGAPGTGKTLAASVLARELGLDLYQIDLSMVVSKYIGETEKQLARLFDEAEQSRAILFFDEADALFGARGEVHDAHDRYANIETSYLLQRMEAYEGVAILASNLSRNMDGAFFRRLQHIVEFPAPGLNERRRLWARVFPAAVPREPDLDLEILARRFELTGAHIRNIALAASFHAAEENRAVARGHVLKAARREYQKLGKMVDDSLFA